MAVNRKDTPKPRHAAPKSPSTSTVHGQMARDIKRWTKEDKAHKSSKKRGR